MFNKIGQPVPLGFLCNVENESTDKIFERLLKEFKDIRINITPAVNRIRKDSDDTIEL